MVVFPNCKINIGLYVTGRRNDGYHDIETVFYPVNFTDVLEIIPQLYPQTDTDCLFSITSSYPLNFTGTNICERAYTLLKKQFLHLPAIQMHLHKNIPAGAGLGGGSADAAFTLQLLNRMFNLQLNDDALIQLSLQLGSDIAFFIKNTPCIAGGRGELLQPIPLTLKNYYLVLLLPSIHISTAAAFGNIRPSKPNVHLSELCTLPPGKWKDHIENQFEENIFKLYPVLKEIKEHLYNNGAVYASMSGTGSTIYGLFENYPQLPNMGEGITVKIINCSV